MACQKKLRFTIVFTSTFCSNGRISKTLVILPLLEALQVFGDQLNWLGTVHTRPKNGSLVFSIFWISVTWTVKRRGFHNAPKHM